METLFSISSITFIFATTGFILTIAGVVFAIYRYFRDPDISNDKNISLLQTQMQSDREGTDRRFKDVQDNFDKVNGLIHDHITNDSHKFETMSLTQISMGKDLVRISTILDERLPNKKENQ